MVIHLLFCGVCLEFSVLLTTILLSSFFSPKLSFTNTYINLECLGLHDRKRSQLILANAADLFEI